MELLLKKGSFIIFNIFFHFTKQLRMIYLGFRGFSTLYLRKVWCFTQKEHSSRPKSTLAEKFLQ